MPKEVYDVDFTLSDEKLRLAALGPQHQWASDSPQEIDKGHRQEVDSDCECEEQLYANTKKALAQVNAYPGWSTFKHNSDHPVAFLKGTSIQQFLEGNKDIDRAIQDGLEIMAQKGLPHLQEEVMELQTILDKRSGKTATAHTFRIEFGISSNKGPM